MLNRIWKGKQITSNFTQNSRRGGYWHRRIQDFSDQGGGFIGNCIKTRKHYIRMRTTCFCVGGGGMVAPVLIPSEEREGVRVCLNRIGVYPLEWTWDQRYPRPPLGKNMRPLPCERTKKLGQEVGRFVLKRARQMLASWNVTWALSWNSKEGFYFVIYIFFSCFVLCFVFSLATGEPNWSIFHVKSHPTSKYYQTCPMILYIWSHCQYYDQL